MAFVPGPMSIVDGTSTTAELQIFDQYGNPFVGPVGTTTTVAYSDSAPTIATETPNADGLTAAIGGVGLGAASITGTGTIVIPPGTPNAGTYTTSDTETVTVTPAPPIPTSSKLAFGSA